MKNEGAQETKKEKEKQTKKPQPTVVFIQRKKENHAIFMMEKIIIKEREHYM